MISFKILRGTKVWIVPTFILSLYNVLNTPEHSGTIGSLSYLIRKKSGVVTVAALGGSSDDVSTAVWKELYMTRMKLGGIV